MSDVTEPEPAPRARTRLLGMGTVAPGEEVVVALEKQLPDGYKPVITSVRRGLARLRILDVQPLAVTIVNEGTEDGSFMLFGATPETQHAMGFVEAFLHTVAPVVDRIIKEIKKP